MFNRCFYGSVITEDAEERSRNSQCYFVMARHLVEEVPPLPRLSVNTS